MVLMVVSRLMLLATCFILLLMGQINVKKVNPEKGWGIFGPL